MFHMTDKNGFIFFIKILFVFCSLKYCKILVRCLRDKSSRFEDSQGEKHVGCQLSINFLHKNFYSK